MIIIDDTSEKLELARIVKYNHNCSFIVLATVIMIINYDGKTFKVQAPDFYLVCPSPVGIKDDVIRFLLAASRSRADLR